MPKLNQIVAIVQGKKSDAEKGVTAVYQAVQKDTLFTGLTKTYVPLVGEEELPSEKKQLQLKVADAISLFYDAFTPLFDIIATQDNANCLAKANVVVDGKTILENVPVTYLLFLEKKLSDLQTFVLKLPTLDPAVTWTYDANADCYASEKTWRYHTRKIAKTIVRAPATDKHPAQVDLVHEDVNVGKWETIAFSGAIPAKQQHEYVVRIKKLIESVKTAREAANLLEAPSVQTGDAVFGFVFGNLAKSA